MREFCFMLLFILAVVFFISVVSCDNSPVESDKRTEYFDIPPTCRVIHISTGERSLTVLCDTGAVWTKYAGKWSLDIPEFGGADALR